MVCIMYDDDHYNYSYRRRSRRRLIYSALALLGTILLGALGFAIYLLAAVVFPWIMSALLAAGIPYALVFFITFVPALIFLAPLFALLCVAPVKFLRGYDPYKDHLLAYIERRPYRFFAYFSAGNAILALLAGIGAGIYLAVLIIPTLIDVLMATGTSYAFALSAGIVTGAALVILTILCLMLPSAIAWRVYAPPGLADLREDPSQLLPMLGLLGGLALGAYISSLIFPLIVSALTAITMPYSAIVFTALIICVELVTAISFCSFAITKGLAYFFNHIDFSRLLNAKPKTRNSHPLIQESKTARLTSKILIQEALTEYHQHKSIGWKLLSVITWGHYAAASDIRKIENFLKENIQLDAQQKTTLQTLLSERTQHTQNTRHFYTRSPNNSTNKVYMTLAKVLTGQDPQESPSLATYKILIANLVVQNCDPMFDALDDADIQGENAEDPSTWAPGNFLVTERHGQIVAWKVKDIAANFIKGGFHSPRALREVKNRSGDVTEKLDPLTSYEYRQVKVGSSKQAQQFINAADKIDGAVRLPPDARQKVLELADGFWNGFSPTDVVRAANGGDNGLAANVSRNALIDFYAYLEELNPQERTALLALGGAPQGPHRGELPLSEFMYRELSPIFALHDQNPPDPIAAFLTQADKTPNYPEYKALVKAIVEEFNFRKAAKNKPQEHKQANGPLTAFIQKNGQYAAYEEKITALLVKPEDNHPIYSAIDDFLRELDPNLFKTPLVFRYKNHNFRDFLLNLQIQPEYLCNQECAVRLRRMADRMPQWEILRAPWKKLKHFWRAAFLAAFYNAAGNIIFNRIYTHALQNGICLDDVSPYKLFNPFRWAAFLIILATNISIGLIDLIVFIVAFPFNFCSLKLSLLTEGYLSGESWIGKIIKAAAELVTFLFTSLIKLVIFLLHTLISPRKTVFGPLLKLYNERPLEFLFLLLLSAATIIFLMTGFGFAIAIPGITWLSQTIFAIASAASLGSPVFAYILALLLITLVFYETIAILDALVMPALKLIPFMLKETLYFISEIRFNISVNFFIPLFNSRYFFELEMPSVKNPDEIQLVPVTAIISDDVHDEKKGDDDSGAVMLGDLRAMSQSLDAQDSDRSHLDDSVRDLLKTEPSAYRDKPLSASELKRLSLPAADYERSLGLEPNSEPSPQQPWNPPPIPALSLRQRVIRFLQRQPADALSEEEFNSWLAQQQPGF